MKLKNLKKNLKKNMKKSLNFLKKHILLKMQYYWLINHLNWLVKTIKNLVLF